MEKDNGVTPSGSGSREPDQQAVPAVPASIPDAWRDIATVPEMHAVWLFHEYYSHGRVRHGYLNRKGEWVGVNANGTESFLGFEPTLWMPIPGDRP